MIWISLLSVLMGGCAKSPAQTYAPPPPQGSYGYAEGGHEVYSGDHNEVDSATVELEPQAPMLSMERGRSDGREKSKKESPRRAAPPPQAIPAAPPAPEEPEVVAPSRMVHYDGWARMRTTDPTDTLDQIAEAAIEAGGRVDRLSGAQVTVRIPVERFEETWALVLGLGDVLDKRVRADDITDQFLAVDLRVRTLRTTQERLIKLLAKATNEEEKLALLQQITRVTEELDATESRQRTLADLASMSRISVDAVPREAFGRYASGAELDGFGWLRSMSPFNHSVYADQRRVPLTVPDEMVSLSKTGPFVAESADGSVLWTMRIDNDPVGTADFWIAALRERIGEEFDQVEERKIGGWACLELDEPGADEPYHWRVCLRPSGGRHLSVAQAYFPTPEDLERYGARIDGALSGTGGGA
ncbi:MAG TPA: DUF4349 domain-containing protein [Deltaproteobacteria bacterium]|nr:DUF4349 domain-containing protein [Deltaproteobacteria bacterium]